MYDEMIRKVKHIIANLKAKLLETKVITDTNTKETISNASVQENNFQNHQC